MYPEGKRSGTSAPEHPRAAGYSVRDTPNPVNGMGFLGFVRPHPAASCDDLAIQVQVCLLRLLLVEGSSQATSVRAARAPPDGPCPGYYYGPGRGPAQGCSVPALLLRRNADRGRVVDTSLTRGT